MTDTPKDEPRALADRVEALIAAGNDLAEAARSEWDTANRASPRLTEALAEWDFRTRQALETRDGS